MVDCGHLQVSLMVKVIPRFCCASFDQPHTGHLGDATVEHVAHHLPIIVRDFLKNADPSIYQGDISPKIISDLFVQAIVAFDQAIAQDVLDIFGGSIETLEKYSDVRIRQIVNDQHLGGANWRKVRLCMYGTTALVALVDPDHKDLWVANLGDCTASKSFISVCRLPSDDAWPCQHVFVTHPTPIPEGEPDR